MHFHDLTPFTYSASEPSDAVLNVGWLGEGHDFPVAVTQSALVSALRALVASPVNLNRGQRQCEFCPAPPPEKRNGILWSTAPEEILGNGEIHVPGEEGISYAAPILVRHYVEVHHYAQGGARPDRLRPSARSRHLQHGQNLLHQPYLEEEIRCRRQTS